MSAKLDESKFSEPFRAHTCYPALRERINQSVLLVQLINRRRLQTGAFVLGWPGTGIAYGNKQGGIIGIERDALDRCIDPVMLNRLVTVIGHELAHAVLTFGNRDYFSACDPQQASRIGLLNEGTALLVEYCIARELGVPMYSDPSGRGLRRRLDALADSLPRQAFIRQARQVGAEDYAARHPSGMNSRLSYRRYYAYLWLISRIIPRQSNQVDWRRLDDACLCYQTDESSREIHYSGEIPLKGVEQSLPAGGWISASGKVCSVMGWRRLLPVWLSHYKKYHPQRS